METEKNIDQFTECLSKTTGLNLKEATSMKKKFLESIEKYFEQGHEKLSFLGWGSFKICERAARVCHGIGKTSGKVINIPAKKVIKFIPGKLLKEKVEKLLKS